MKANICYLPWDTFSFIFISLKQLWKEGLNFLIFQVKELES